LGGVVSASAAGTLARALRFVAPLRARVAGKIALMLVSVLPLLLVPWPGKIVIDHVIEGRPVEPAGYPFFVRPFAAWLAGAGVVEILLWTAATTPRRAPRTRRTRASAWRAARSGSGTCASRCGSRRT
jgi:hypothetical protein